jgi:hypothetical protein
VSVDQLEIAAPPTTELPFAIPAHGLVRFNRNVLNLRHLVRIEQFASEEEIAVTCSTGERLKFQSSDAAVLWGYFERAIQAYSLMPERNLR